MNFNDPEILRGKRLVRISVCWLLAVLVAWEVVIYRQGITVHAMWHQICWFGIFFGLLSLVLMFVVWELELANKIRFLSSQLQGWKLPHLVALTEKSPIAVVALDFSGKELVGLEHEISDALTTLGLQICPISETSTDIISALRRNNDKDLPLESICVVARILPSHSNPQRTFMKLQILYRYKDVRVAMCQINSCADDLFSPDHVRDQVEKLINEITTEFVWPSSGGISCGG